MKGYVRRVDGKFHLLPSGRKILLSICVSELDKMCQSGKIVVLKL